MSNYLKKRNSIKDFTLLEKQMVEDFLSGKSIRQLQQIYEGYGRTAIRNILKDYAMICPEKEEEINSRILRNKTHKNDKNIELREISSEQIEIAYEQIKSGVTLTQVANDLGRTRDYIKKRIIEYLNDPLEIETFQNILNKNQDSVNNSDIYENFINLPDSEKKKFIFEKLNSFRVKHDKNEYSYIMLERKFERLKNFFLKERNSKISDTDGQLTEEQFWKMLYDNPYLLAYSLSDKIKPAMRNLDENPEIGYLNSTYIIVENSTILASSISRTNLQIQLLVDNNLLEIFLRKPRYFRTSPEMMYALIKLNKNEDKSKEVFITKTKLNEEYSIDDEKLKKKYPIEEDDRYNSYEYFD